VVDIGAGKQVDQEVAHGRRCRHQRTVAVADMRAQVMPEAVEHHVVEPVAEGVELPWAWG